MTFQPDPSTPDGSMGLSVSSPRSSLDLPTAWMVNELGADAKARERRDHLRGRERDVLARWRDAFGTSSSAEMAELVRTAHVIRDSLRPDQVGRVTAD